MTLHTAKAFEKALGLLASYSYDLVILDIMGVRGFEFAQNSLCSQFAFRNAHSACRETQKLSKIYRTRRASVSSQRYAVFSLFLS